MSFGFLAHFTLPQFLAPSRELRVNLGFTLAELLIALGILGLIAAFTIPKVLTSQQNAQKSAMAKETAAAIAAAYQSYVADSGGNVPTTMTMDNLLPLNEPQAIP